MADGTDELLLAVYGPDLSKTEKASKYLGGSTAVMLYDAANRIKELAAENARLRESLEEAESALTDARLGSDRGYSRLAIPYTESVLSKIRQALKSPHGEQQ